MEGCGEYIEGHRECTEGSRLVYLQIYREHMEGHRAYTEGYRLRI